MTNEVGGSYGKCVGEGGEAHRSLLWRTPSKRSHFKLLSLDVDLILKWISRKWDGGLDWFDLAHHSDSCRAVMKAVMKLRVA
jgi:hypothetical protein